MYVLKDNLILNVSSFLIILYLFVPGIIQSYKDLEECERLRQNKIVKDGWPSHLKKLSLRILLISTCLFIAGLNASLKWLWITIGSITFICILLLFVMLLFSKILNIPIQAMTYPTKEMIDRGIKKGKYRRIVQSFLILLWIYSWKVLIV
jgi:hypothetical protein